MLIEARPIAVSSAVLFFFGNAIIGMLSGVSIPTCSQRSCLVALITYLAVTGLVKAVNAILVNAVIDNHVLDQERETGSE